MMALLKPLKMLWLALGNGEGVVTVGSGSSSGVKNMSIRAVDSRIQINLNGREIAVSSEISAKIFETLKRKNKIEAIKLLRTEYGLELIEAKGLVDTLSQSTT
jgi:ribosomal protein L7/L12